MLSLPNARVRGQYPVNGNLPPYLMTSEPNSFARATIVERKPQIIRKVIKDNGYPPEIVGALDDLQQELAHQPAEPLPNANGEAAQWNEQLSGYAGSTWLELPWYLAEAYFYRRLLGAVRYFEPGPWQHHDPFEPQKRHQVRLAAEWLADNWEQLAGLAPAERYVALLHSSLWGNRADLSNEAIRDRVPAGLAASGEQHYILIDDTEHVAERLAEGAGRVDFVNDNVGLELLFDLALADYLLAQGWAGSIVLHLKDRPFFVSDAMPQDVRNQVSLLETGPLGRRLAQHLEAGRVRLEADPFWTTSLMFSQMPAHLSQDLGSSDLVFVKGDVNYRRLLGDRHWPHDTPLESITTHFPAPFVVLRTLKGEILAGLQPGQAEELAAQDPTWLINGKRGIIQLVTRPKYSREQ